MARRKKKIARLALNGISALVILLGFCCFYYTIYFIISFQRDNLISIFISLIASGWMFALGTFFIYLSYKILQGRSFSVIKPMAALLAFFSFTLVCPITKAYTTLSLILGKAMIAEEIVGFTYFLLALAVAVLVYKISVKLLERLVQAAYGPYNT